MMNARPEVRGAHIVRKFWTTETDFDKLRIV